MPLAFHSLTGKHSTLSSEHNASAKKTGMKRAENRELTIRGTILPLEWDRDGMVNSIGIESANGEEYIIFLNQAGEELFPFVDHMVEATGTVKKMYGDLIFTISTYRLIKRNEETK